MTITHDALGKNTKSPSLENEGLADFTYRLALQSYARTLIPNHRIKVCLRNRRPQSDSVTLVHDSDTDKIKFNGLMVCKNVWVCPICTKRIMAQRAQQIETGLKIADKKGFYSYLLTVTLKHSLNDRLSFLLDGLNKSYKYLFSGKTGQTLKKELGYVGGIKALEIKWGYANGFHPHNHIVIISDKLIDIDAVLPRLKSRWIQALNHYGYEGDYDIALDLRDSKASLYNYLTKQASLALELTHNANKSSKHHYSPLALLDLAYNGDKVAESTWLEYAESTFGQRMITFSKGLKDLLEIKDIKESESIAEPQDVKPYAIFNAVVWRLIRNHNHDLRSSILRIANTNPVHVLIDHLVDVGCLTIDEAMTIHPNNPIHDNPEFILTMTRRYFERESIIEF